jgi:hypothetical protein
MSTLVAGKAMMAAELRGIVMLAKIAIRQALDHGQPKPASAPHEKAVKKYMVTR